MDHSGAGTEGLRLAYVSDQRFLVDENGTWYSSLPLQLDTIAEQMQFVETWTFVGRLGHYAGEAITQILHSRFAHVLYDGIWDQRSGPIGYVRHMGAYLKVLRRVVASHDILVLKFGAVSSLLTLALAGTRPIVVGYTVSDLMFGTHIYRGCLNRLLMKLGVMLYRHYSSRLDLQVFVSDALARAYGNPRGGSIVVANENRVSSEEVQTASSTKRTVNDPLRVVYVGRLSPEKGLDVLVEAFGHGVRADTTLTFIGDGQLSQDVEAFAAESTGAGRTVRVLGPIAWGDSLFAAVRQNDVLVLPSLTEGLGLVLLEAMSNGVAVVASDVGGIPGIVVDGANGLLVPPGDSAALAAALNRLADDEVLRQRLIVNGLKTARENCLESQLVEWIVPLERLVQRRREEGHLRNSASGCHSDEQKRL
jgi:glycosyltransferase involved in cell wall biosynthesis